MRHDEKRISLRLAQLLSDQLDSFDESDLDIENSTARVALRIAPLGRRDSSDDEAVGAVVALPKHFELALVPGPDQFQ